MSQIFINPAIRIFWEGYSFSGWHEPLRKLYDCELVYVSEGSYTLMLPGCRYQMNPGSLAIIPPDCWHESMLEGQGKAMRHCIHFDFLLRNNTEEIPYHALRDEDFQKEKVLLPPPSVLGKLPLVIDKADLQPVQDLVSLLFEKLRNEETACELLLWPILQFIFRERKDVSQNIRSRSGKTMRAIFAVKQFIEQEYNSDIGYTDFIRVSRLSRSRICTAFKNIIGTSPSTYLREVRLQQAKVILSKSQNNISETARLVGISDANYFTRIFSKRFGFPPGRYLREIQQEQ